MKLITQYLTGLQLSTLLNISEYTGLPRAELIRRAIDDFIKNFKYE